MCDEHPNRLALARVQGETDSFGCEYNDLCLECVNEERAARLADREGECDWCKNRATDLYNRRDYEEGMGGRVYRVCGECIRAENKRLEEEESYFDNEYDYYDKPEIEVERED